MRTMLIDRMIKIYGSENSIVADFIKLSESTTMPIEALETLVKCHEISPVKFDEDEM